MARHGYVECACFTCFDAAVCSAPAGEECDQHEHHLCSECDAAGCDGHSDCAREDLEGWGVPSRQAHRPGEE